jgi:alkaline phosphatase
MGAAQRTAARWQAVGQGGQLAMDRMDVSGWSRTGSADKAITDSAAAATALATGVKTNNGMISIDPYSNTLTTILEQAQAREMAVGLVTTVEMAHATPAAFASHVSHRSMMTEIASQMLDHQVDVLLGGGEDEFLPTGEAGCYSGDGARTDGRNLTGEAVAAGYTYVCTPGAFAAVPVTTTRLLGLFGGGGMTRPFSPTLVQMTQKSIDILSQDPDGFFLMVEGGQIDWACHANDAANAITDTIDFDAAVAVAQAYAATNPNALVIVTADHETGGMSVTLDPTGDPREDGPFRMPDDTPFYVNWTTGGHTAADVPVTAQGAYADLLNGTSENAYVYSAMFQASVSDWWVWLPLVHRSEGE